jgi:hypothetical protein
MNIVIDYMGKIPNKDLVEKMDDTKTLVKKRLQPLEKEIKDSVGILVLYSNGEFEFKETPANLIYKIRVLLNDFGIGL